MIPITIFRPSSITASYMLSPCFRYVENATLGLNERQLPILEKRSAEMQAARTPVRVASETPLPGNQFAYGVEFLESDSAQDFWGINFPAIPSSSQRGH